MQYLYVMLICCWYCSKIKTPSKRWLLAKDDHIYIYCMGLLSYLSLKAVYHWRVCVYVCGVPYKNTILVCILVELCVSVHVFSGHLDMYIIYFLPDVTGCLTTLGRKDLFWLMVSGDIRLSCHGRHTGTASSVMRGACTMASFISMDQEDENRTRNGDSL